MTEVTKTITRRAFVTRFMRDCGMTYNQASRAYECMCGLFEDGIVSGSKIRIGRIGAIVPVWRKPREFTMHFKMEKGRRVKRVRRTYALDGRYVFKFNLYQRFVDGHSLRWFQEFSPEGS